MELQSSNLVVRLPNLLRKVNLILRAKPALDGKVLISRSNQDWFISVEAWKRPGPPLMAFLSANHQYLREAEVDSCRLLNLSRLCEDVSLNRDLLVSYKR